MTAKILLIVPSLVPPAQFFWGEDLGDATVTDTIDEAKKFTRDRDILNAISAHQKREGETAFAVVLRSDGEIFTITDPKNFGGKIL